MVGACPDESFVRVSDVRVKNVTVPSSTTLLQYLRIETQHAVSVQDNPS